MDHLEHLYKMTLRILKGQVKPLSINIYYSFRQFQIGKL